MYIKKMLVLTADIMFANNLIFKKMYRWSCRKMLKFKITIT